MVSSSQALSDKNKGEGEESRLDKLWADALVQLMTATEIKHVHTINSDETVRLYVYVRQWLLE